MLGFAPIAFGPLSSLPQQVLYPYKLTNVSYIYELAVGVSPVTITTPALPSGSVVYAIRAGLGLANIYPDLVQNQSSIYGVITYVFDKPATTFKTNIVVVKEPYNVVTDIVLDKFIKNNVLILG
jgi:hypothetical protein